MSPPVWVCYECGRPVKCDVNGEPMDWFNEEGDAGPLLAAAVCEDWPDCEARRSSCSDDNGPQVSTTEPQD